MSSFPAGAVGVGESDAYLGTLGYVSVISWSLCRHPFPFLGGCAVNYHADQHVLPEISGYYSHNTHHCAAALGTLGYADLQHLLGLDHRLPGLDGWLRAADCHSLANFGASTDMDLLLKVVKAQGFFQYSASAQPKLLKVPLISLKTLGAVYG